MTLLAILATISGVTMSFANIPQAIKIFKRKSAKDISAITYATFGVGGLIWFFYGLEIGDWPVMITNSVGTITVLMVLAGWWKYG